MTEEPSVGLIGDAVDDRVYTGVSHAEHYGKVVQRSVHCCDVKLEKQVVQLVWKPAHSKYQGCN